MGRKKPKKRKSDESVESPDPSTDQETESDTENQDNTRNIIQVRHFMRRVKSDDGRMKQEPTQTVAVTFASTELPDYVYYLDRWRHEVKSYIPPVKQCLKCLRLIMVLMESVVSGHKFNAVRERLAEKLEMIKFDPYIQHESLYRERKKIKSIKS